MKKLLIGISAVLVVTVGLWLALAGGALGSRRPGARPNANQAGVTKVSQPQGATVANVALTGASIGSKAGSSQAKSLNEGESGGENEGGDNSEPPGEPQPGHEDPPGQDVNHECPPNCDTGNGEQP